MSTMGPLLLCGPAVHDCLMDFYLLFGLPRLVHVLHVSTGAEFGVSVCCADPEDLLKQMVRTVYTC